MENPHRKRIQFIFTTTEIYTKILPLLTRLPTVNLKNTECDMHFKKKKVVSFIISGRGSNFKAVADKIISGYIHAETGIMISSSLDALALKKSEDLGIRSIAIEPKNFISKDAHEAEMIKYLECTKPTLSLQPVI